MRTFARSRLAASSVILSVVVAACGGGGATPSPSSVASGMPPTPSAAASPTSSPAYGVTTLYVLEGPTTKIITEAAQAFSKGNQGTIEVTQLAGETYQTKMRTIMGSGKHPDMFYNWGGATIRDYVDANLLLDLGPMIAQHPEIANRFQPSVVKAGQINGKQYALPLNGMAPVLLFYNKTIFDKAGLQPPKTWDDVKTLVTQFKSQGITPFALAGSQAWCELEWMEYLVDRLGGPDLISSIVAGDWSKWGDPAVLQAAQMAVDLVNSGAFGTNFSSIAYGGGGSTTMMTTGKAAMTVQGAWEYPVAQGVDAKFVTDSLAVAPFPSIPGGKGDPGNLVGNPANFVSVSASAQNIDTIAAFLAQLSTDDYATALMKNSEIPATKTAADFVSHASNPAFARLQIDLVSRAPAFQLSWDLAVQPKVATPLLQSIQDLFNGVLTPQAFVSAVQAIQP